MIFGLSMFVSAQSQLLSPRIGETLDFELINGYFGNLTLESVETSPYNSANQVCKITINLKNVKISKTEISPEGMPIPILSTLSGGYIGLLVIEAKDNSCNILVYGDDVSCKDTDNTVSYIDKDTSQFIYSEETQYTFGELLIDGQYSVPDTCINYYQYKNEKGEYKGVLYPIVSGNSISEMTCSNFNDLKTPFPIRRDCINGCSNGVCVSGTLVSTTPSTPTTTASQQTPSVNGTEDGEQEDEGGGEDENGDEDEGEELICTSGCEFNNDCVSVGYRKSGQYCAIGGEFVSQLEENSQCDNNFECSSNLCIDNQCISSSLFQKILEWFRNLFGIGEGEDEGLITCQDECINEFAQESLKQCSLEINGYQTCGNYDEDSCLELSDITNCPEGESCQGGGCIPIQQDSTLTSSFPYSLTAPQKSYIFKGESEYDPTKVLLKPPIITKCSCDTNPDTKDCPNSFLTADPLGKQCNDYYKKTIASVFFH